ncbi:MAG: hypothetical protein ACFFC6_18305 [Promethearchaeota archaeon]
MNLKIWRIKHIILSLMIILIHSLLIINIPILIVSAIGMEEDYKIIDLNLRISQQIEVTQQIITINYQSHLLRLVKPNYMTFARFRVKNTGDELKEVTIKLSCGKFAWQEAFQRKENLIDYSYDFMELTELYVPLEGINNINTLLSLNISIKLEYYLQLSDTSATFTIFEGALRQVCTLPDSDLLIFPNVFYFTFPNLTYSFQTFHFILTSYYLTNISASERLLAMVTLITEVSFEVIESNEVLKTDLVETGNFTGTKVLLDNNLSKIHIHLEIQRDQDQLSCPFVLKVHSSEKQLNSPSGHRGGDISPIYLPSWLLLPLLFGFFFVPIIYLFKQQLEDELDE